VTLLLIYIVRVDESNGMTRKRIDVILKNKGLKIIGKSYL